MIIFFGQPGTGKTTQGKMLAASQDWCWVSAGQLLRDSDDNEIQETINAGKLVSSEKICALIGGALSQYSTCEHVVIDGFARRVEQAKWLIENSGNYNRLVEAVFVINVSREELIKRLLLRGRDDDTEQAIKYRLEVYDKETFPVLDYFEKNGIKIIEIDGSGTPEEVHSHIINEIKSCKLA